MYELYYGKGGSMHIGEGFTLSKGEKALVIGCKPSDLKAFLDRNKLINERIEIISEDDLVRKGSIPNYIKGVLSCRHINHPDYERIKKMTKSNGIYLRMFSRSVDLKTFLSMSVICDDKSVNNKDNPSIKLNEVNYDSAVNNNGVVVRRKAMPGELSALIITHGDLNAENTKEEFYKLQKLFLERDGIEVTVQSIGSVFCRLKRKITPDKQIKSNKKSKRTKKKKDDISSVVKNFLDSISGFNDESIIASVAIYEIIDKWNNSNSDLIAQKKVWMREKSSLTRENRELKRQINLLNKWKKEITKVLKEE